jgi:hypothetical protein
MQIWTRDAARSELQLYRYELVLVLISEPKTRVRPQACVPAQPHIFHNVHSSTKHQGDPPTTAGTAPGVLFGPYLV